MQCSSCRIAATTFVHFCSFVVAKNRFKISDHNPRRNNYICHCLIQMKAFKATGVYSLLQNRSVRKSEHSVQKQLSNIQRIVEVQSIWSKECYLSRSTNTAQVIQHQRYIVKWKLYCKQQWYWNGCVLRVLLVAFKLRHATCRSYPGPVRLVR